MIMLFFCLFLDTVDVQHPRSGPFHLQQMHGISESVMDLGAFDVEKPVALSIQLT
jgi:hypothetical protein